MRCLALAQAWRRAGGQATFLTRCESARLGRRIEDSGVRLIELDLGYPDHSDLRATLTTLGRLAEDTSVATLPWLAVDGYHFDSGYHRAVRSAGFPLLVIDDTAHLPCYDADLVVNQNLGAEKLAYPRGPDTTPLLGIRYALLRSEFLAWQGRRQENRGRARRVLVTMGGSDTENVTLRVIHAVERLGDVNLEVRAIVGPFNPHRPSLEEAVRRSSGRLTLLDSIEDMPALLSWPDLAISAAGVTCWELAFLGTPMALVVLAENQRHSAAALESEGAAACLGDVASLEVSQLAADLERLVGDPARLRGLADRARSLVDGQGASRVVSAMTGRPGTVDSRAGLSIRRARAGDARTIWKWANDPTVRANAFNPQPIPWETHISWYQGRLRSPATRIWILEDAGEPVGQIRYDRDECGAAAEISYSIAGEHRGKGYGKALLRMTRVLALAELEVEEIRGVTLAENEASRRAFSSSGFFLSEPSMSRGRACYQLTWRPC